ncbi:MAG TPA: hypothetical protein VLX68_15325 [Chitinivibrionales bacterium]|nr:hypothetical protein [Chitinivibrionales bacterium]
MMKARLENCPGFFSNRHSSVTSVFPPMLLPPICHEIMHLMAQCRGESQQ